MPVELFSQNSNGGHVPGDERSSFPARKKSIMDGNQLRATYHNTGHAGRTGGQSTDELLFEFPINTGRTYMFFTSVMIGATVEDQTLNNGTRFPIVNVADFRTSPEGRSWAMNPLIGYQREDSNEMARSDRGPRSPLGNTWPDFWPDKLRDGGDGWPGSWNGFFGRDQFNADLEFFYRAGDDLYDRFASNGRFRPDNTDPSRGGLGIILDTRVLAWSQVLVNAIHFNIFEIFNDSSFDYPRVAFGLWIADLIDQTASNDQPIFDDLRAIAFLTDLNRDQPSPAFGPGERIGEMSLQFLETPGNAFDGIDNDGDSNTFDPFDAQFFNPDNADLYTPLTIEGGGFYTRQELVEEVIPQFTPADFQSRTVCEGDKIVRILDNGDRVIEAYPEGGGVIETFGGGRVVLNPGCTSLVEDIFPEGDPLFGIHIDGFDNDLDGLIDENRPNHLEKQTFLRGAGQQDMPVVQPLRHINYLHFEIGDTLKRGLIVPNRLIRERMAEDEDFSRLITDYQDMLNELHGENNPPGFFDDYFFTYHTAAPMIDESRFDFWDNDRDWLATLDDVGIEGDPDRPSRGAGDGFPTSGAGTPFPGEPAIDKTDPSESDMLGVTRATIFPAGSLNANLDARIWNNRMIPGTFDRAADPGTDSDLFVSSGLFPLNRGERQGFAVAITAVQTNSPTRQGDRDQSFRNLAQANVAFEADFQFARAPDPPIVTAVPGDGFVTIYWDDSAEDSFDRFLARLTGNGFDFEGYKLYKATDTAFEDARGITDAFGNQTFLTPIAIFDRQNGISGLHPVPVNGVQFNMGNDSGLQYSFVDTDVNNGKRYFYAVTSFDFGFAEGGIAPSESPMQISEQPDGTITFGQNVVSVRPSVSQAGLISPENPGATLVRGSPGGSVTVDIVDPQILKPDNLYSVVFEDTLIVTPNPNIPDTIKTKNFSLINITGGIMDTLIDRSVRFNGEPLPVTEGFRLRVQNVTQLGINQALTGWSFTGEMQPHRQQVIPANVRQKAADYMIVVDELGFGQSSDREIERAPGIFGSFPSIPTNFKVYNTSEDRELEFAYFPTPRPTSAVPEAGEPGEFSAFVFSGGARSDVIWFIEDFRNEEDVATYSVSMSANTRLVDGVREAISRNPQPGDTLFISINKPFQQSDEFQFRLGETNIARIDQEKAKLDMDNIKVVPNPYIVTNPFEPRATNTNPQQQRELHFTHLPVPSTLRIFTVSGFLIREIKIDEANVRRVGGDFGGTYVWDMLTRDNLEISYGVYLFHVDAPGVGEKTGKFAVIK
ncbi:MAG: hypothetical protein ACFCU6_13225 [Balneolaceae bacterium]